MSTFFVRHFRYFLPICRALQLLYLLSMLDVAVVNVDFLSLSFLSTVVNGVTLLPFVVLSVVLLGRVEEVLVISSSFSVSEVPPSSSSSSCAASCATFRTSSACCGVRGRMREKFIMGSESLLWGGGRTFSTSVNVLVKVELFRPWWGGGRTFSTSVYVLGKEELFRPWWGGGRTFSTSVNVLGKVELFRPLLMYFLNIFFS